MACIWLPSFKSLKCLCPGCIPRKHLEGFDVLIIISVKERIIPIKTPFIVPSKSTPRKAPIKIRNSVLLTFHNLAAKSNSVAPISAEITIAVKIGIGRYPINPVPQRSNTIIENPATMPVS